MSSREEVRNGCLGGTSPIWSQGVAFWTRCNKKEGGKEEGRNQSSVKFKSDKGKPRIFKKCSTSCTF